MTKSRPIARRIVALLGIVVTAAIAWMGADAQGPQRSGAWKGVDCGEFKVTPPAGSGVDCGYVTVPLRHAAPAGATIQLATVIIPSRDADRRPDPLFMAQGGPGGSTIETYANYLISAPESRPATNRDIVLWDQRGTFYSKPALLCPEVSQQELRDAQAGADGADSDAESRAAYRACGARLAAESGDLSAFNSAENADDIESLRAALGYDQINFYGVSYGTELGQFLIRRQPAHVRSAVLDAVVPLSYNLFTEPAFAQQRIGRKYLRGCAAEPRCNAAFPNLVERYLALVDRLNAKPVTVTVSPLKETKSYQIQLTGDLLESALYTALYMNVHDLVPLIVDRADHGDYTFVSSLLLPLALFDDTMATGMHMTVACADRGDADPAAVDFSALVPRLAKNAPEDAKTELQICRDWNIALLPRSELDPVRSDVPVLLLSGDFDPITPPEYAATLLATLSSAQHVLFSLGSHGQAVTDECANRIIRTFLDNPSAAVDAGCATVTVPRFATDADIITLPRLRRALAAKGFAGLLSYGVEVAPPFLAALLLLTAIPVYAVAWIVARFRGAAAAATSLGWTRAWSRAAPWLAVAAALVLLVFFVGVGAAILGTLVGNQNLLALGAIPARWRWVLPLPWLATVLVALMLVAAVALWIGNHRSTAGRMYYTLLTLAALAAIVNLFELGAMRLS